MTMEQEDWLSLTIEDPLDPDLPICDPHHHLWDRPGSRYVLEDLSQDIAGGHNLVETVFVECRASFRTDGPLEMRPVGETEFVSEIAEKSLTGEHGKTKVAAGIVAFADLTRGAEVAPVLEAHLAAGGARFKGIRHSVAWDAYPEISGYMDSPEGLLLDSKFREGFACLGRYGLSFDSWLYHPQLMELADLAGTFPETTIIVDHIGGPLNIGPYAGKREEVFREWKNGMRELAGRPNVVVKLGGLGMPIGGFEWAERTEPPGSIELAEATSPYYTWCIEEFGASRCMFESNFPVDKVSYSYTVMWNAFKRIVQDFSPEDKAALFYDTAASVYRLAKG